MKIHDEIDEWTAGALCGVLSPDEQQNFEQHLAECPHCRSLYEENQKMNTILNETLPELRPDHNFERRIIARFREKVARSGFHPLRGLAWLMRFRIAQAAFAIVLLAALVKVGAFVTGEHFPVRGTMALGYTMRDAKRGYISGDIGFTVTNDYVSRGILQSPETGGKLGRDSFGLTKAGNGTLILNGGGTTTLTGTTTLGGANTYTGTTTVNAGTLNLASAATSANKLNLSFGASNGVVSNSAAVDATSPGENVYYAYKDINGDAGTPPTVALGDIPITGRAWAENGRFVQDGRIVKDHSSGSGTGAGGGAGGLIDYGKPIDAAAKALALNKGYDLTNSPVVVTKSGDIAQTWVQPGVQPQGTVSNQNADAHKLIRNAALEIEVEHFENAMETIATVAGEEQGYVNTQNSERGANGKLQGVIVVKILPASLDRFLLKLRALGDLKNQTLGAEDVTKAYFDTDARLRNSKRMEERLIDMLKKNTGKVSDLLQVEKELSRVREQIEQMQGQLKYYDALVAYATVTISLREKDLSQAAAYLLREHANLSLFAKDVEKAFAEAKGAAETAKAQTVESHIERDGDGRVTATLHLLFAPEVSDEAISKLKTLGRIQNFNSQTQRVARGGSGNSDVAKIERDKVELNLTIQRDEETAAQQTGMSVLTDRVEEKAAQIKQAAAKAGVEVKNAAFNRTADNQEVASLTLRMPMQKYPAFLEEVKSLGKVKDFTVSRRENAVAENAPAEITLQIFNQGNVVPDNSGLFATIRKTLGEGFGALMWSARMIGVSLAFIAPWGISLGLVIWLVVRRRGAKKL